MHQTRKQETCYTDMGNPDSPNYLDLCGMNAIKVKTQKDYTFMHGLADLIYLLHHFSDKIHFFTA